MTQQEWVQRLAEAVTHSQGPLCAVFSYERGLSDATVDAINRDWKEQSKGTPLEGIPVFILQGGLKLRLLPESVARLVDVTTADSGEREYVCDFQGLADEQLMAHEASK